MEQGKLFDLFKTCPRCTGEAGAEVVLESGTMVALKQICTKCPYSHIWESQPKIRQLPLGNLVLSSAILLSGSLPTQALRLFSIMGIHTMSRNSYNNLQGQYVCTTIINGGKVVLEGDGRCDSPGYCAKYGTYTVIEGQINQVLDVQLVQV